MPRTTAHTLYYSALPLKLVKISYNKGINESISHNMKCFRMFLWYFWLLLYMYYVICLCKDLTIDYKWQVHVTIFYYMAELVFSSWRTLIGCWEIRKKAYCPPGRVRFGRENVSVDSNENKKGLGNVRWKSTNNIRSCNISVAFLESCLSISEANECLTSVNMKWNQETQLR